ncbi:MAG TPA: class II aldolase/adducin family protein, partial [Elusimicrobiota bacterium]|nr:class II aldolase/adducin family protein [Elusimicrobiota bacterium]
MPDPFLADFVALNRRLGGDPLLSQGSGGNTSVKIDPDTLRVKATGVPLREVSENRGWVDMDLKALRAGVEKLWLLKGEEQQQRAYRALLSGAQKTPEPRVSIETNLHVLLADRWVAHVHSLGGQLLGLLP